ncbi:MAG TPA: hypothetical protein VMH81_37775 [Bryobacteraceae bacterium]|nr:hypothetical protein [Bryobacteraceae bacterium]
MQRIYRFEVIEERYHDAANRILGARDSVTGSSFTLCEWTPVDAEKLGEAAASLDVEFFSAQSSYYLAWPDDSSAAAALERLRAQGWFSGLWPGLTTTPPPPKPQPDRPQSPPPQTQRPLAAWLFVFALALLVSNIGWFSAYDQMRGRYRDAQANASAVESNLSALQKKWDDRKAIDLSLAPLTLQTVELWNSSDGKRISPGSLGEVFKEATGEFSFDQLRYLDYKATFRNNHLHRGPIEGTVQVKFLDPDGSLHRNLLSSPIGYTEEEKVSCPEDAGQASITTGWGNKDGGTFQRGPHTIEFWFNGALVGSKTFSVY